MKKAADAFLDQVRCTLGMYWHSCPHRSMHLQRPPTRLGRMLCSSRRVGTCASRDSSLTRACFASASAAAHCFAAAARIASLSASCCRRSAFSGDCRRAASLVAASAAALTSASCWLSVETSAPGCSAVCGCAHPQSHQGCHSIVGKVATCKRHTCLANTCRAVTITFAAELAALVVSSEVPSGHAAAEALMPADACAASVAVVVVATPLVLAHAEFVATVITTGRHSSSEVAPDEIVLQLCLPSEVE